MSSGNKDRAPEKTAVITGQGVTMAYGDFVVMRDLDFTVNKGDIFIIMGGSGCGKSTLLRVLVGLLPPAKGRIRYGDKDFWAIEEQERLSLLNSLGILYQSGALWSSMTLAQNIALPLKQFTNLSPGEIKDLASLKLELVGLAGFEDYYPSEISGGMCKRAGLARAMALDPDILFFDEPSAGLDPVSAHLLDELILELRDSLEATFVIVTHELASIFTIGSNSIFLDVGARTATAWGDPRELLKTTDNPKLLEFLTRGEGRTT
ncbi:MAG: ABC transporter ATP-binding protein [Thermodesulfobacteriota bacterium]